MSKQFMARDGRVISQDDWIIETLLIEAHGIIHNHSKWIVCSLCEPEDCVIGYPPPPFLEEADLERLTQREAEALVSGKLPEAEQSLIRSMGVKADATKQLALQRIFTDRLRLFMAAWLNLFDGTVEPRLVEATDPCVMWSGARIRALSPQELREYLPPEGFLKPHTNSHELKTRFENAYSEFRRLISAEPYVLLKVKHFDDDATVIDTLMLEAYCEIELQSREFVKDLPSFNSLVYEDEYETNQLMASEKQAIHAINLQDETVKAVLQKLFAACSYGVVSLWLEAFDWKYSSQRTLVALSEQQGEGWQGAKLSSGNCGYGLFEVFDDMWHEFVKIKRRVLAQPPQRPF